MTKKIIVSGVKPSGELHIGNYLGAIKQFLELQSRYDCYFFIADLHSLTEAFDPKEKSKEIHNLVIDLLALGIDPKRSIFFIQSHVPQCLEMAWIFNCLTPTPFLERMTQYKDFISRKEQSANAGLLTYPVLQAADILLYRGTLVPVGKDQLQHLELTNDIVKFFNNKFGKHFAPVLPILTEAAKIMSITDPKKKMSKSMGAKSYIALRDEPEVIYEKIKKTPTGTGKEDILPDGAANLLSIFKYFGKQAQFEKYQTDIKNKTIQYSKLKEDLAFSIADYFAPFREKYKNLEKNPKYVEQILREGKDSAQKTANEHLKKIKKIVGLT